VELYEKSRGLGASFSFSKGLFLMGGEGKRGAMAHPFQRDFFSCTFRKGMERCFFSSVGTFSMRGCFLIDMRDGRGLVVSKFKG